MSPTSKKIKEQPKKRSLLDIAKDKVKDKFSKKKKPTTESTAAKKKKSTTSKDVPGKGMAKNAAEAIEKRKKLLKNI